MHYIEPVKLKKLLPYIFSICFVLNVHAQYYFRGEIRNTKNILLQNVKILLHSSNTLYYTGDEGSYGINSSTVIDSATLYLDGYETKMIQLNANVYAKTTLKEESSNSSRNVQKLISVTKDLDQSSRFTSTEGDESYFSLVENEIVNAKKYPNTGFSLNVDKLSIN